MCDCVTSEAQTGESVMKLSPLKDQSNVWTQKHFSVITVSSLEVMMEEAEASPAAPELYFPDEDREGKEWKSVEIHLIIEWSETHWRVQSELRSCVDL